MLRMAGHEAQHRPAGGKRARPFMGDAPITSAQQIVTGAVAEVRRRAHPTYRHQRLLCGGLPDHLGQLHIYGIQLAVERRRS